MLKNIHIKIQIIIKNYIYIFKFSHKIYFFNISSRYKIEKNLFGI